MAAYTRYYPSGTSDGNVLPAAWVNYIDSKLPDIINADGGTWAPSTAIVLGGSGINITGPALFDGTVDVGSGANVNINNGADIEVANGGDINVASGGSIVLAAGSDLTIANITNVTAATYTKTYRFTPAVTSGLSGFTEESSFASWQYWLQGGPLGSDHFGIGLPALGASATVTYIAAHVKGASGHSWPIGTMPRLLFGQVSTVTGAISTFAYATDTSGSASAYQSAHLIVLSSPTLSPTSLSGVTPVIQLRGESGTNALAGLQVYAIDVQVEYTAVECGG